jgi:O-antigen ligase
VSELLSFLTFPLGLALYSHHERLIEKGALILVTWASIISLYGLFQYLVLGHRDLEHRITGPTPHVMTFSGILLAIVFVAIVKFIDRSDRLYGLAAGLISVTLVLTLTRNAWLGWLAGVASLLLLKRSRLVLFLAPLTLVALVSMPLPIFGRLISTFDPTQYSNLDRIRMIEAGVEIIRDHPLLGVGPGMIDETYPLYRKPDAPRFQVPHLHNNFVQLWAERGVMAAAAYLLLFGMLALRCFRDSRSPHGSGLARAGLATTIALFVSGVFEFNFGDSEVLMTFLDVSALVAASIMVKEAGTNGSLPPTVEPRETPQMHVLPRENGA